MTKIEEFAQAFTAAVQDAFVKVYGPPSREQDLRSVRPSWSIDGVKQGWHDPDPRVVVVGTEYSWIRDPYLTKLDHESWDKVMDILAKEGWGNVSFESINAAVHIVYINVPKEWNAILIKRALERGRRS